MIYFKKILALLEDLLSKLEQSLDFSRNPVLTSLSSTLCSHGAGSSIIYRPISASLEPVFPALQ